MRDTEHPIDSYITQLARRLHLPAAERDQVLAEVRGHLEERAGAQHETGVSDEHAERQAVLAFGPVGRISRELRVSHPIAWGKRRWIAGMLTGAAVTYAIWVVASLPDTSYSFYGRILRPPIPLLLWQSLLQSLGLGPVSFYKFFTLPWPVVLYLVLPFLVLLVLYLVLPFRWGRRAQHWWAPGLAYGLGTCLLTVPDLFVMTERLMRLGFEGDLGTIFTHSLVIISLTWMSVLALPVALAASFVGWWWRERSASTLGRAEAA